MEGVIQKYKELIQTERENSRKRRDSHQSEEAKSENQGIAKPLRRTIEQALNMNDQEDRTADAQAKPKIRSKQSSLGVDLSGQSSRKQVVDQMASKKKQLQNKDMGKPVHMQMVQKVTRSIIEVFHSAKLSENEKPQVIEQLILDLIMPTFEMIKDLEERLNAASIHSMLRESARQEEERQKLESGLSPSQIISALEHRVQELNKDKSELESQIIVSKKEIQQLKELANQPQNHLKPTREAAHNWLSDKLLEAHDCLIKSNTILREQFEIKESEHKQQQKLWEAQLQEVMSLIQSSSAKEILGARFEEDTIQSTRTSVAKLGARHVPGSGSSLTSPRLSSLSNSKPPAGPQTNSPGIK